MSKIIKLSEEVIAKVAAGEVVERPASAVKELLENSIDAKASKIEIHIENSGLKKIRVIDNGVGMGEEDLKSCFQRYTTSKIKTVEDLFFVKSLGFRGEALYSISAVSALTIKSRQKKSATGFLIQVKEGKFKKFQPVGMPSGTEVVVEDLFQNIPARKKFLKTEKTEFRNILEVITRIALSNPSIKFTVSHNGKTVLELPSTSMEERMAILLGEDKLPLLSSFKFKDNWFSLYGFISKPQLSSTSKNNIYVFVNNRNTWHKLIPGVLKEAYGSLLDPHSYPYAVLFLELPYEMVDVNVHPRKEEVKFFDDKKVMDLVGETITKRLSEIDLSYKQGVGEEKTYLALARTLKDSVEAWDLKEVSESEVLQVANLYLVTKAKKGLIIFDQHAAHEKILFDQFMAAFKNKAKEIFVLKNPVVLNLPFLKAQLLESHLEFLERLGFEIEEFGKNSFRINTIPEVLKGQNISKVVVQILDDILDEKNPKDLSKYVSKIISYLACRTAIKAGEYLTPVERKNLIKKVLSSDMTYTCPHGRPLMVEVSLNELGRMFKRSI